LSALFDHVSAPFLSERSKVRVGLEGIIPVDISESAGD
jgi:hypothetical protein